MLIHATCKHCGAGINSRDNINWVHIAPRLRYCSTDGMPGETVAEPLVQP